MRNNLTRGVRKASDFLMALQLSGAFQRNALSNLQVELPAIVVVDRLVLRINPSTSAILRGVYGATVR